MAHVIKRDQFIELAPKFMYHSRSISQLPKGDMEKSTLKLGMFTLPGGGGGEYLDSATLQCPPKGQSHPEGETIELSQPEKILYLPWPARA